MMGIIAFPPKSQNMAKSPEQVQKELRQQIRRLEILLYQVQCMQDMAEQIQAMSKYSSRELEELKKDPNNFSKEEWEMIQQTDQLVKDSKRQFYQENPEFEGEMAQAAMAPRQKGGRKKTSSRKKWLPMD